MNELSLKLQDFFFEAASATYAGFAEKATIADLPKSKVYRYQRHEYLYIDTYFTNEEQSGGQTIIYIDHGMTPAWLMQYHGWCKNDEKLVLDFLKEVLVETYRSRKFVGGRGKTFSESPNHPLRYFNKWSGTFCDFSGQERIEIETLKDDVASDWKDTFWHRYHGLMLLPGYDVGK